MSVEMLKPYELVYIATPFTLFKKGHVAAFREAARLSGRLIREGVSVFSPIAHFYPIAENAMLDPLDGPFWIRTLKPFMERCDALAVGMLDGWEISLGVAVEIDTFHRARKPVFFIDSASLDVRLDDLMRCA